MKKFYTLVVAGLVATVSFPVGARKKIHISDATNHWTSPALYAWSDDTDCGLTWPGEAPGGETEICGQTYRVFYSPVAWNYQTINLIYNNGVTGDESATCQSTGYGLTLKNDCFFRVEPLGEAAGKETCRLVRQYRMVVNDHTGWDDMYVYAWGNDEKFGPWPGTRLDRDEEGPLLLFDGYDQGEYHLIFNDGNGSQLEEDSRGNDMYLAGNADNYISVGKIQPDTATEGYVVFMVGEDGEYGLASVRAGLWKDGSLVDTFDAEPWTEIKEGYFYRVYVDDFTKYDGIEFYLSFNDGVEKKIVTWSGAVDGNVDADWHRYIYGPAESRGQNDGQEAVPSFQSYYTPAQFLADYMAERTAIYGCGNMRAGLDWDLSDCVKVDLEDGLGVAKIVTGATADVLSSDPPRFKLSWVDVVGQMRKEGAVHDRENTGSDKRAWATFNLGIMGGYHPVRDELPDYMTSRSFFYLRRPVKYYGTSTADWTPFVDENGNRNVKPNTTYYLVVDTDPEFESVTLLTFDPTPEITSLQIAKPAPVVVPESYSASTSSLLQGSAYAGEARVSMANTVAAEATVVAADTHAPEDARKELEKEFDVYYDFYHSVSSDDDDTADYQKIGRLVGNPQRVRIPNIALGKDVDLVTRGVYYAKYEDGNATLLPQRAPGFRTFASRKSCVGTIALPSPVLSETPDFIGVFNGWEKGMGVHLEVGYSLDNPGELEYSPDYTLTADGYDKAIVAHNGLWYIGGNSGPLAAPGFIPYSDGEYIPAQHNWSDIARQGMKYHLHLPVGDFNSPLPQSATLTATMVYPFVINPTATIEKIVDGNAGAPARAEASVSWQDGMMLYPVRRSDIKSYDIPGSIISGIGETPEDETSMEATYYNLQGTRIDGEIAPGLYIVVRGNRVSKEYLR